VQRERPERQTRTTDISEGISIGFGFLDGFGIEGFSGGFSKGFCVNSGLFEDVLFEGCPTGGISKRCRRAQRGGLQAHRAEEEVCARPRARRAQGDVPGR